MVICTRFNGASQVTLMVKNLPASAGDTRDLGLILGWKDPLDEVMANQASILAWRIPQTEEPGRLDQGRIESDTMEAT